MKNLNVKAFIWVLVLLSVLIWAVVLCITGTELKGTWGAIKHLPTVVSIDAVLWLLFVKWGWKYRIFQKWLVPFPDLEGTWQGALQTIWSDSETGNIPGTIPIILVIKQSFIFISCVMYSQEMTSRSCVADFLIDTEANLKILTYTYTSIPRVTVRDRSIVHNGTVLLNIITSPDLALHGEYWTNRKSAGEITVKFRSKELLQDFPNHLIAKEEV